MGGYESISQNTLSNKLGHDEEFYKAIVGPKNQNYYLYHFAQFHSCGKAGVSWHWPVFFLTFFWLLYRKIWLDALIYCFLYFLILLVDGAMHFNFVLYFIGIFIVPSMYANALYYQHCKEKISTVKSSSHASQGQLDELSGKGGTSLIVPLLVVFLFFMWILNALLSIRIPLV